MKNLIKLLIIFVFFFTFFFLKAAFAQETLPLMVAPARMEIEVEPGEKTSFTFNFYNKSSSPVSGFFKVADFLVLDNKGTPVIIDDLSKVQPKYSASSWISSYLDRATLPANEKVSFQANVNVPKDAKPGGRYVALYFEPNTNLSLTGKENEAGTGISSRIVGLLYLKVKGPITEKAYITRFFAPSFLEYGPIEVQTDILNRGDIHIRPRGAITLTNVFGFLVDQKKFNEQNIFPDTLRTFEDKLGKKWMFGPHILKVSLAYGNGQTLEKETQVIVFPLKIAVFLILTLIILYLLIKNLYQNLIHKQVSLEKELEKERQELENLKKKLQKED